MQKQLLLLTFLVFFLAKVDAKVIFVNQNALGSDNGTTWQDAYVRLDSAILHSEKGDELWIAKGNYSPQFGSSIYDHYGFFIDKAIDMYGGFIGSETQRSQRNPRIHETKLQKGNNVLLYWNIDGTAILDGFSIEDGQNDFVYNPQLQLIYTCDSIFSDRRQCIGAGVYIYTNTTKESAVYISNCLFKNNRGIVGGAIGIVGNSALEIDSCTFDGNYAEQEAAAIYAAFNYGETGKLQINHSSFRNNNCQYYAGALSFISFQERSTFSVKNCLFEQNRSNYFGPTVIHHFSESFGRIENCVFRRNRINFYLNGVQGVLEGKNLEIANCSFLENKSDYAGIVSGSNFKFYNALFYKTEVKRDGACARLVSGQSESSKSSFVNCTFLANTTDQKGALAYISSSDANFENCIFQGNKALLSGSGVYSDGASVVSFQNVISDLVSEDSLFVRANPTSDSLIIKGAFLLNTPLFFQDTAAGNFQLSGCSIGRNLGDSNLLPIPYQSNDLAGKARIQDGQIDLGAYEQGAFRAYAEVSPSTCLAAENGKVALMADNSSGELFGFWPHDGLSQMGGRSDLNVGTYEVMVSDEAACKDSIFIEIVAENEPFAVQAAIQDATNSTSMDGSITLNLNPSSDSINYTFLWSNGQTGEMATNLSPGFYTVTINDAAGCSRTESFEVSVTSGLMNLASNTSTFSIRPNLVKPQEVVEIVSENEHFEGMQVVSEKGAIVGQYQWQKNFKAPTISGRYWIVLRTKDGKRQVLPLICIE